jgi:hypothetical protein
VVVLANWDQTLFIGLFSDRVQATGSDRGGAVVAVLTVMFVGRRASETRRSVLGK